MQIISADMGRNESKFVTLNGNKIKFKSVIGDWYQRYLNSEGNYDVNIDGENFFVGDLSLKESHFPREMTTLSKIHPETMQLFLVGIALLAQEEEIAIVTGLPVDQFNPSIRDEIVDLLKGRHVVSIQGHKTKHFFTNQITVCPEGGGAYWHELNKRPELKYGKVRVVDIGSRTINYVCIEDGNYINKDSNTLPYGAIKLRNSKTNPQEFARKIVADLSSRWMEYNENNDVILLSGGGAIFLEPLLKPHFKKVIVSNDPVYANAYGFYNLGLARYGKQLTAK